MIVFIGRVVLSILDAICSSLLLLQLSNFEEYAGDVRSLRSWGRREVPHILLYRCKCSLCARNLFSLLTVWQLVKPFMSSRMTKNLTAFTLWSTQFCAESSFLVLGVIFIFSLRCMSGPCSWCAAPACRWPCPSPQSWAVWKHPEISSGSCSPSDSDRSSRGWPLCRTQTPHGQKSFALSNFGIVSGVLSVDWCSRTNLVLCSSSNCSSNVVSSTYVT